MEKINCELCGFRNPKGTATAVIIKDNKILLLKRNNEPFVGSWDLPGGFMQEKETPEQALIREVEEELGGKATTITFIKTQHGTHLWKKDIVPILTSVFLVEINGEITLDAENSEYRWVALKDLDPKEIALDSNQVIVSWLKDNFIFELERVKELTQQLDPSVVIYEQALYRAVLNGFVSKIYDQGKLVGLGWIFARQTMLRKQAVVEDMIVDENYRGKGYGKKMLLELIDWARQQGVDTIELTSNPKRIAANELYKKVGFSLHPTNHYLYKI